MKPLSNENLNILVLKSRSGDNASLNKIFNYFGPFIKSFTKNIYIRNFDKSDIYEECNFSILLSIKKCDIKKYNFTAYTISSIKNNIYYKIRNQAKFQSELSLNAKVTDQNCTFQDILIDKTNHFKNLSIKNALTSLDKKEQDIIDHIYFLGYSSIEYSKKSGINYRTCLRRKNSALKKLKRKLN
ncbi:RNA polymerase sigma factor (sigma-70 family) [Clostridium acetobutylicum]|uniref:Uncharacterized protein CA_P0167 n=2 Tax=Clostridium acetobutylicum TaxID=1488 RepID=Y4167_CLOAB|nr:MULTISPECIES: sigma-70 family RNA polymerase sigma factor [Clostridium]P23672.1 RecName: Full=Uncharacterized protein CA_P0167 [Clostridium acetobutylicum ATCC 824]AAA63760.1 unknown [Clostridium acetobutylicum ATCC 824]AAD47073.1 unknown [Clostridium acetobutylicum ATCC 824]AAK76912.1 Specialized sigma factor (SigF/SigE family) [Clostridium acetobutylicum ATCC 824]ADZ22948.1 Specialized sigma factor (SigF/SigE family) [Clostridium acetobutylicum EA 2018]AEI34908.1 sigF/sigE family sigma f